MKYTYLLINFITIIIPFLFSFHSKLNFYKTWKAFFGANLIATFLFVIWDIIFTNKGIWGFNPNYITGVYVLNLPIEEILFFICIPFSCVFTYHSINLFLKIQWGKKFEDLFCVFLILLLLTSGIIEHQKLYTSITFISTAILLFLLKFVFKIQWFGKFIHIYPVLLIPFFIVNGVLTGTGLHEPIVWYNNAENMGIRLFTIPIEDVIYGFELILLNIFLYDFFITIINNNDSHNHINDF